MQDDSEKLAAILRYFLGFDYSLRPGAILDAWKRIYSIHPILNLNDSTSGDTESPYGALLNHAWAKLCELEERMQIIDQLMPEERARERAKKANEDCAMKRDANSQKAFRDHYREVMGF